MTDRASLRVGWPQSEAEQSETDSAVNGLLQQELTAETAVQVAVLNNRALRATFEEIGLSQGELIAASRLHNPTFSARVRWPDHKPRGPNAEFSIAADLLDDLLIPIRRRVAREQVAQTERRVAHEVLALAAEVKLVTYTVQARQQLRERLATIADVNAAAADLAQRQFDAGNINRLELATQQLAAEQTKLDLTHTQAQVRADRERLNRLLGLSSALINWKISSELPPLPQQELAFDGLEDLAVEQRLDLAVAKSQISLAKNALDLKRKTRFLPGSLNFGVDTERDTGGGWVTGPSLDIGLPIFDQGQADLARLSAEFRRATDNYQGLATDIRSEVREARDSVLAARASADFYTKTMLPQRRLILQETLLHYNAMQKSSYELLAAKERQLTTEHESINALRDYWIARAELERAVGGKFADNTVAPVVAAPKVEEMPPEHQHPSQK